MGKLNLSSSIPKPIPPSLVNLPNPNFIYPPYTLIPGKKGMKNYPVNQWDNPNNTMNTNLNSSVRKDDNNNKNLKKKDKMEPLSSSSNNNSYDTSIVINGLSKDITEKAIQMFYKDFQIKNLKINRNSENIIAYIDFENSEMCTEAKKLNIQPLKDNRKKFSLGRIKHTSE
ncbi:hypothetical protein U3516DRAFT_821185, partial [Neocallimastix sp. 'constans']